MKKLVCLIFIVLLAFAVTIAAAEEVTVLSDLQTEWSIASKEETIIPIDYKGVDYSTIGHKAANDKFFLHYLDEKGIHILPIAAGKGKLTLTNSNNKKDKVVLNIIITEDAVYPANEPSPLRAYIVFNETKQTKKDGSGKYIIMGGTGKYAKIQLVNDWWDYEWLRGSDVQLLKKSSGTFKDTQANVNLFGNVTLIVRDSDGNEIRVKSQPVKSDLPMIIFNPYYISYNLDNPLVLNYTVVGGKPPYKMSIWVRDNTRYVLCKEKKTINDNTGIIEMTVPKWCAQFNPSITITDKSNQKNMYNTPNNIKNDKTIAIKTDKILAKVGENITFSIIDGDGNPFTGYDFTISFKFYSQAHSLNKDEGVESIEAIQNGNNYTLSLNEPGAIKVHIREKDGDNWSTPVMCLVTE